jgi:antitoxin component of MazEF toxin-antitoxin module
MSTSGTIPAVKLVPHGNSYALVFDPTVLQQLGIDENTPLDVTSDGKVIRIERAVKRPAAGDLQKTLDRVNAEWGPVLKKLAE